MSKTSHDSETPAHGKQVFTACAFIHSVIDDTPKVFLPRRATSKQFMPGVYELPGGHIDYGEDMVAGLKREIHEEFSMELAVGDPFFVFTYQNPIKGSHSIEVVYFAQFVGDPTLVQLNPEDHSEYRWVGQDELHHILSADKNEDDIELAAIRKGFALLAGEPLHF